MKTKEKQALREKTQEELRQMVIEAKQALEHERLEIRRGKVKNTSALLHKKKDIAKMSTILREKELLDEKN